VAAAAASAWLEVSSISSVGVLDDGLDGGGVGVFDFALHMPAASNSSSSCCLAAEINAGLVCDCPLDRRELGTATGPLPLDAGLDGGGVGVFAFGAVATTSGSTWLGVSSSSSAGCHARCGSGCCCTSGCCASTGCTAAGASSTSRPPSTCRLWAMRE